MKKLFLFLLFLMISFQSFALDIKSSAFENGGYLPDRYTCDGQSVSVPLEFSNIPDKAKSLVLICDDPDALGTIWAHWLVYNIASSTVKLEEGVTGDMLTAAGALQGINDFGETAYGGACPPEGKAHKYVFKLYALDTLLQFETVPAKKDLEKAMTGHILAETKISGLYQRKNTN